MSEARLIALIDEMCSLSSVVSCMSKRKPETSSDDQHAEFVKAARELGTDDDPAAFDRMLKKITKAPPPKTVQKRKRTERKSKA